MTIEPLAAPSVTPEATAPWHGRRVVITGGLGFIGSSLAHALVAAGARVRLVDALLPLYGGNWFNLRGVESSVSVLVADVRGEQPLSEALAGCDTVFHVAAQTSHVDSMTDPLLDADINVRGMLTLLDVASRVSPDAVIVNVGTRAQYGRAGRGLVDERVPFRPADFYGVSKAAAEGYGLVHHSAFGLDFRGVRATNAFGPRHQMKHGRYGILNWFVRLALDGCPLPVYGDGRQLRDFLYIDDLVDALLRVAGPAGTPGAVYNVGTGAGVPFVEMARDIGRLTGAPVEHAPWPADRSRIESGDFVCDPSLIRAELGWSHRVSLEAGLRRTIDYYRAVRDRYW